MTENTNPYQTPESSLDNKSIKDFAVIAAGKWLRFFNLIFDYIAFFMLTFVIGIIVALIWGDAGVKAIENISDSLLGIGIMLFYFILFESTTGRTLGKFITVTKVVDANGMRPSFGQIVGRCLCRFIPFEAFSFLGDEGRGWHDSIPKTYVIKCR